MNSERGNPEWINDYLSLKQVNSSNPFTVPDGYFNELEQQIESSVKLDELKSNAPSEEFAIPENYFEELSSHIISRINIEKILNKEEVPFTVPEGYFDDLNEQVQGRIIVEKALNNSSGIFAIPENYFDGLTQSILNNTTLSQAAEKQPLKQQAVVRRLFSAATFKYATAACITIAIGATLFLNQGGNSRYDHNHSFLHKSISAIPVNDIKSYLQQNVDATDTRTLIDSKEVNADNLSTDLQDELDTSQ